MSASRIQELMQQAVMHHQQSDFKNAETLYRQVLAVDPAHPDANHFLGLLAHQTGHGDAGLALLKKSVQLGPGSALYRHNLGGVYRELGQHSEAERCYREALTLKPDYIDALIGLAMTQSALGHFEDAHANYAHALVLEPDNFEASLGLGGMLMELARRREAMDAYAQAHKLAAGNAAKLQRVGLGLRDAGALLDAKACFEEALRLRPEFVEAHNGLGIVLGNLGDFRNAELQYREALRLRPAYTGGWHNLVGITPLVQDDPLWGSLQELVSRSSELPEADASMLQFALGKVYDDRGDYAQAFEHYLLANRLKRQIIGYDEARQKMFFQNFVESFNGEFLLRHADEGADNPLPVFIVGMSRSGTTLVEQVLASHPHVYGGGEQHLLRRCLRVELGSTDSDDELPLKLAALGAAGFKRIGERYCSELAQLAPHARRITDKLPGNMALVGLIHIAFPGAKIIHCVRDPLDTCVSCFSKLFTTGHAFSYQLDELGRFYRMYQELMRHWLTVLPAGRLLEVRYEEMVADVETQARKLVQFCRLPWDDACLRFHENRRAVTTASLAQVRQPIYSSSLGRWHRYESYLTPLQQALGLEPSSRQ